LTKEIVLVKCGNLLNLGWVLTISEKYDIISNSKNLKQEKANQLEVLYNKGKMIDSGVLLLKLDKI